MYNRLLVKGTRVSAITGSNPKSILIMDNCSIHHIQEVADYLQSVGILVIFLPPYSPDLNPLFSFLKYYLKEHDEIIQALNNSPIEVIKSAFNETTARDGSGMHVAIVISMTCTKSEMQ